MPRILTLKQNVRMQVQNPTPIESPEAAASAASAGYKDLGKGLEALTSAVADVYQSAGEAERKFQVGKAKIDADSMRAQAQLDTEASKDPMGRDKEQIFTNSFDKSKTEYFKHLPEGDVKRIAELSFYEEKAKGLIELKKQAPIDAAKGAHLLRKQNADARLGQASDKILSSDGKDYAQYRDSKGYMKLISDNDNEIAQSANIYDPQQLITQQLSERKALALATVRSFAQRGDYKAAKVASHDLSEILGEDRVGIEKEIETDKYTRLSHENTMDAAGHAAMERATAEKKSNDYIQKHNELLTVGSQGERQALLQLYKAEAHTPEEQETVQRLEKSVGVGGRLSRDQKANAQQILDDYAAAYRGDDVVERVKASKEAGVYNDLIANEILQVQLKKSAIKNSKKSAADEKFKKSGEVLNEGAKNLFDTNTTMQMNNEHINNVVGRGEDPLESAVKVKAKYAKREELNRKATATDPMIVQIFHQPDVKSLSAILPLVKQKKNQIKAEDYLKMMQAYDVKMQLLNFKQGAEDERKR
jgi:hypothetical protein